MGIEIIGGNSLNLGPRRSGLRFLSGGETYTSMMRSVFGSDLMSYHTLSDAVGSSVALDSSGNGRNGVPANVTFGASGIGDGLTAATFSGASNSSINLIAATGLAAALQAALEAGLCSIGMWIKMSNWTDGTLREMLRVSLTNNFIIMRKSATNNVAGGFYFAAGASRNVQASLSSTDWIHLMWVIDRPVNDKTLLFVNGQFYSPAQTTIGTWSGTPTAITIGAGGGNSGIAGQMAHVMTINRRVASPDVVIAARGVGHVTFEGDSRSNNTFEVGAMAASSNHYGYDIVAESGSKVSAMVGQFATQVAPMYRVRLSKNIFVLWGGVNDVAGGDDLTTLYNNIVALCTLAKNAGFLVIVCTEIDARAVSLDAAGWHDTLYPALNVLIRANYASFAHRVADLGDNANLQDATNTTYFNVDQIHPNTTGYAIIDDIVAAAIDAV